MRAKYVTHSQHSTRKHSTRRTTTFERVPLGMYTCVERTGFRLKNGKPFWRRKAGDALVATVREKLVLFILTMTTSQGSFAESYARLATALLERSKTTPVSRKDLRSILENLQQYESLNEPRWL